MLRLSVGAATRPDLSRDLKSLMPAEMTPAAQRTALGGELVSLAARGLVSRATGRVGLSADGVACALGLVPSRPTTWAAMRDGPITLLSLGADASDPKLAKAIANPDGLRALVVQFAYGLPIERPLSLGKLRTLLALRALERAFGNQIKAGLGSGSGLAPKPSRLLAGQLLRVPKEFTTDGRLIAALAADHLGAVNGDPETLRSALVRRWVEKVDRAASASTAEPPKTISPAAQAVPSAPSSAGRQLRPANDRGGDTGLDRSLPAAVQNRPDLPGFAHAIKSSAQRRAQGWPGNLKAFICHVWEDVKSVHPQWGLSEIEFKGMLAEAHRTGALVLANADLKDKRFIQEFEKSAIQYKNTVWHFVRVDES